MDNMPLALKVFMMTLLIAAIAVLVVVAFVTLMNELDDDTAGMFVCACIVGFFYVYSFLVSLIIRDREERDWKKRHYWSIQILKCLTLIAAGLVYLFLIPPEQRHILIYDLKKNAEWLIPYACLCGSFYLFSSPFIGTRTKPSFAIFYRWYCRWFMAAALYHVPIHWLRSTMGVDMSMNKGLFWTIYMSSILTLIVFHIIFLGLWYIGIVPHVAGRRPQIMIMRIIYECAVISALCCALCCAFYSRWGSDAYSWPKFSKWVIYGKNLFSQSPWKGSPCPETSDKISPLFSIWAAMMCIYIAIYVQSQGRADNPPFPRGKPKFKEMVPWYSGTSADLYKTAVDLLVSATIFIGRFDMRMMQAVKSKVHEESATRDDFLFEHYSKEDDLWFDFMADTGDGGNSSYTVAHLLAQPLIDTEHARLQRGKFLLIGGDLAYPNPSEFSYENRLFRPFEYALQPPPFYEKEHITVNKPKEPCREYKEAPWCFVIPGNHDWFDGLQTFTRYICHRSWLGGWWLPQKRSYFALKLPKGWWVFGLDQALHNDIDDYQFKFFAELIEDQVGEKDSVIVMTHEPNWLLDWYSNDISGKNDVSGNDDDDESRKNHESGKKVSHLIRCHLKGRCKLRMAGDLHHYMHHTVRSDSSNTSIPSDSNNISAPSGSDHTSIPSDSGNTSVPSDSNNTSIPSDSYNTCVPSGNSSDKPVYVQHLLVNGCGGAFLHPTHTFENFQNLYGTSYRCTNAYPSFEVSRETAWKNVFNFQQQNRQFDIVGGVIYFILTFSMFPQDQVGHISLDDWSSVLVKSFFSTAWSAFVHMISHSYVSLGGTLLFLVVGICFVPPKVPLKRRVIIGTLHVSAHIFAAVILMLLFELGVETCIRHQLLSTSGYHTSYELYRMEESKYFPDLADLRGRIERWTFGFYPACIKYLMLACNVPEVMTVIRANIFEKGMESIPRGDVIIYYVSVFLCFWLFSTYMVSMVFGGYLYICVNWFNLHYDEAFSSFRNEDFKAFTRFHIKDNGDLEIFTVAVDKVPKDWKRNQDWSNEQQPMSHLRVHPSEWTAADGQPNPFQKVRIVDQFVIERGDPPNRPNFEACNALGGR